MAKITVAEGLDISMLTQRRLSFEFEVPDAQKKRDLSKGSEVLCVENAEILFPHYDLAFQNCLVLSDNDHTFDNKLQKRQIPTRSHPFTTSSLRVTPQIKPT